jgi:predicted site-specific integrase-resolvase
MNSPRVLTAGEVAAHCGVSYEAVKSWVNTGKLKASFTPGRGTFRIRVKSYHFGFETGSRG